MNKFIKKVIEVLVHWLPLKSIIVFESNPDYACNTYPAFLELRKRLPKYKMVWNTKHGTPLIDGVDAAFYYEDKGMINKLKSYYFRCFAKAFITSNRFMGNFRKGQVSLYLTHGSKTKRTRGIYEPGPVVDFINSQSHFFDEVQCYGYNAQKEQLVYLGYPRCDYFFQDNDIAEQLQNIGVDGEYIIWLPTFRKNLSGARNVHSDSYEHLGIPLIYDETQLCECNDFLKQYHLHILYKPHPAQDVSGLTKSSLSNIHVISDTLLADNGLQLYQVIAESKALISDYSSVFFDYLMLNRPIATTTDDLDIWKQGEGFAYDLESMYAEATDQVATLDELYSFIQKVIVEGKDIREGARKKICLQTVEQIDGNSSKRVADFVLKKIGEIKNL